MTVFNNRCWLFAAFAAVASFSVTAGCNASEPGAPMQADARPAAAAMMAWRDFAGQWDVEGQFRFQKDSDWTDFEASSKVETTLNGAGLLETIENPKDGYYSVRVYGYNEAQAAYELASFDIGGMVSLQAGALAKDAHKFVLDGRLNGEGPVQGMVAVKSVLEFVGENEIRLEEYAITESGDSFLGARAVYRRR